MTERGKLRIYLGAAPGVGKTFAMLGEGRRRADRGADVVVGLVETHNRRRTVEQLEGLEVIPRRRVEYRGAQLDELDVDALLTRRPEVALIDELAHSNAPGSPHDKRWQDVEQLLEAGIDVISTLNVQHLESLSDVVEQITGVPQRETVPDSVVRAAEQVELVDMTAEALRRRMAHGNIYQADKVDAALSNYFRPGNLSALRELALLWLADSVDEGLQRYREQQGIAATWETRERVVVALTGGPEGETLIRRAARIAARGASGDLFAVHIARSNGLSGSSVAALDRQRLLVESLGGSYHSIIGDDVAKAVLEFARANNATQIVIGASRRNPVVAGLTGPGTGMTITRRSGSIDVHVVSHDYVGKGRVLPRLGGGLTLRRRLIALLVGAVLLSALTPLGRALEGHLGLGSDVLLFLLAVVIVSLIGGFLPAVAAAIASSLLLNYFFVAPRHAFTISEPENVLTLAVFILIALLVSRVVDRSATRTVEAARANAEAETLSTLAGSVLGGERALPALLGRVQETFGMASVALLRRDSEAPASAGDRSESGPAGMRGTWSCVAGVGEHPPMRPEDADADAPISDDLTLVMSGRALASADQRVLAAFATQVAVAYEQRQLSDEAAAARLIVEADRSRTELLNAVSHDLRAPVAEAKAAVSALRAPVAQARPSSPADADALLAEADDALDRLTALVANLLDLSRLRAGALAVATAPVAVAGVGRRAMEQAMPSAAEPGAMLLDVPHDVPPVLADPGLLERALANLAQNALQRRTDQPVRISASAHRDAVEIRVIDDGPKIAQADRDAAFRPFQSRDRHSADDDGGIRLSLAIARGFVEAMQGQLSLEDTPGGGLTATIALPAATA